MGSYTKLAIVAFLVATTIMSGPSKVAGETLCGMSLDDIMACKPAVTANNPVPPTSGCCSALSKADLQCLCGYKKSKMLSSLGIDPTQAMQLPVKCNLMQAVPCV